MTSKQPHDAAIVVPLNNVSSEPLSVDKKDDVKDKADAKSNTRKEILGKPSTAPLELLKTVPESSPPPEIQKIQETTPEFRSFDAGVDIAPQKEVKTKARRRRRVKMEREKIPEVAKPEKKETEKQRPSEKDAA